MNGELEPTEVIYEETTYEVTLTLPSDQPIPTEGEMISALHEVLRDKFGILGILVARL